MKVIDFNYQFKYQDYAKWMGKVPEKIQVDLNNRIPSIKRQTKKVVQDHLSPRTGGVDEGIYKKSFRIIDLSENKWHIGFQVVAKKPHYRLTHLLENGHAIKIFTKGRGEPTRKGNIGMTNLTDLTNKRSPIIEHIKPGQMYADKKIISLYRSTIHRKFSERN